MISIRLLTGAAWLSLTPFSKHGYDRGLIYRILNGRAACWRGKSYEAAQKLGIKTPIAPGI